MSKILIANWTWYPSGGDWTYIECLKKFYESRGHEVIPFSMHNEKNFETPYSKYFISGVDYKELNKNKSFSKGLQAVKRTIYSAEAKRNIARLLDEHKVDIVHLNNVHHYLTPASIIPEIRKRNIPIIWTIHDYVILCANTTFVSNGVVCEKCRGGKFINCAINKCKKGSRAASIVASMESYANNWMNPYKHVDYYIFPSNFIRNKFDNFGFHKDRLVQIYNMFDLDTIKYTMPESPIPAERPYIVYVGNTLRVKGIFTLVDAMKGLDIDLYVIGDGEHFKELQEYIATNNLTNIKLLGRKTKNEVFYYTAHSLFMVLPTIMYENLPYSVMECALLGRPTIGARTGGIPELIVEGKSGYLFEPGNVPDLRSKIDLLLSQRDQLDEMGRIGKDHVMSLVTPEAFGKKIAPIFESLKVAL